MSCKFMWLCGACVWVRELTQIKYNLPPCPPPEVGRSGSSLSQPCSSETQVKKELEAVRTQYCVL